MKVGRLSFCVYMKVLSQSVHHSCLSRPELLKGGKDEDNDKVQRPKAA